MDINAFKKKFSSWNGIKKVSKSELEAAKKNESVRNYAFTSGNEIVFWLKEGTAITLKVKE